MRTKLSPWSPLLVALCLSLSVEAAQGPGQPLGVAPVRDLHRTRQRVDDFLAPFGRDNFSAHYVEALRALLESEARYGRADYEGAQEVLDALWARHPVGGSDWAQLPTRPFGINIGSPPAYYALRMLSDMTDWRVTSGVTGSDAPRRLRWTVLVVGETTGIEPRTVAELQAGTGVPAIHTPEPALAQDSYAIVHRSLRLFREYVLAMTEGGLALDIEVLPLPDVSLPVHAFVLPGGGYYAGLVNASLVWASVPTAIQEESDGWFLIYPSHVPEQYPAFAQSEFITGGMGTGPDGVSPLFIADDRWIVRKPPHLGSGPYTDLEREAYLPQWLQHEFFHHLFRSWPEFGLEATSHQWFDHSTWPADFVGTFEPDYYHEALLRRLQSATPSLRAGLRYATADAPYDQLDLADLLRTYRREPVENPWHVGDIQLNGAQLL